MADQTQKWEKVKGEKSEMMVESKEEEVTDSNEKMVSVVCCNCGETGHYSSGCNRPKSCFICHNINHVVDRCPKWQKHQSFAQYYGSANRGLGFYHIDVEPRVGRFKHWVAMDNFGVLAIEEGEMEEEGIKDNLKILYDRDWNWQLRKSGEFSYIIRLPPHRKIENTVVGKASMFYLNKPVVLVSLKPWNSEVEPISELVDVWVQIKEFPQSGWIGGLSRMCALV